MKKIIIEFYIEYPKTKPNIKIVTHINKIRIIKKIPFSSLIQRKTETIKKFLETKTYHRIYMRDIQNIKNFYS